MLSWVIISKNILNLVQKSDARADVDYGRRKFQGLIRYYYPNGKSDIDRMEEIYPVMDEELKDKFLDLIISIPENERILIATQLSKDLMLYFPEESNEILTLISENSDLPAVRYQKNLEKLNKYIYLIDIAIFKTKYYTAYKLAYRCLREYYRAFYQKHNIQINTDSKDISHISISTYHYILKYLSKYGKTLSSRTLLFMSMVSHNLSQNHKVENTKEYESKYDRFFAEYAKENVSKIIKILSRYF